MTREDLLSDLDSRYPEEKDSGFDVLDFASRHGCVLDAITRSFLLWPEFVEYQNMIFINASRKARNRPAAERIQAVLTKRLGAALRWERRA